jgi:CheY-like chemotaxis protein
MQAWPEAVHEKIRRSCLEAYDLFSKQISPPTPSESPAFSRSKRYALNVEEQQYLEMVASPVLNPAGQVVQVVAVVWDATGTRRLQQKIDAIDKAGRELVRLEAESMAKLHIGQRLKLLEDKIISFTRDLMHFDHFAIRVLDRRTNKLEIVISAGLPQEALCVDLFAEPEGNGISGFVAATRRSYICPDVQRDPRYVAGLDNAQSTLTVPLMMNDKVVGIFNVESRQKAAFNEDDRQFAEIFGRYVAMALGVLDLMVVERVNVSHKVADDVSAEVAGPLNDIASEATSLMDDYIGHDELRHKLQVVLDNVGIIRKSLRQVAEGTNTTVLGAQSVKACDDPVLKDAQVLIADDEPNIRDTISDILRKYQAQVTVCANGSEAIAQLAARAFDLVLSDIKMPDKTGYEVFDAARKHSATMPVILMTGAHVLVADDEPNIRLTISDVLRKFHVNVTIAPNGAEAIALVEKNEYDLVLSDIKMPDKTGYEVFAAVRRHSPGSPVILMTGFGYDPHHSILRASQEGLQAVLFKPFKVEQLLAEVRKAILSVAAK